MPCSPITINVPPGPSGPAIPNFGIPFALDLGTKTDLSGFPEDLLGIIQDLQLLTPTGPIQSSLSFNFGIDVFDAIMSLLDKFFPFLMLYKFFLPVLDLIICIIEVICALINPFALIGKVQRLFRVCIPEFLALFPIFALIVMLLSLMFLILSLIEYIIGKIIFLVELLLNNITALVEAFQRSDQDGVYAITQKLGLVICAFQNLFVLLVIFDVIINIIKDILKLVSAIPPCSNSGSLDTSDTSTTCCGPETCPAFIKNNTTITAGTGSLQYYNEASQGLAALPSGFPANFPLTFFTGSPVREESWQFYDVDQSYATAFSNITNAYDLPQGVNIVFFPTSTTYTAATPIDQAPYLVDLTLFYNPTSWDRTDNLGSRFIQINNCIVTAPPVPYIINYESAHVPVTTGVLELAGGLAFENDGITPVLINGIQATLNTFIHLAPEVNTSGPPPLSPTDGYLFSNVTYTFTIQHPVLFANALITLGCIPSIAFDRDFVNTVYGGNAGVNFAQLNTLVNSGSSNFPDVAGAQQCLSTALAGLASNVSTQGVATFQSTATTCLTNLQGATNSAIINLLGIGYDPYQSIFTLSPTPQFTNENITIQVTLNETNGQGITAGLPASLGPTIAQQLSATASFGNVGEFIYDGAQFFNAQITSPISGSGTVQVFFNGIPISTATLPSNLSISPSVIATALPYTFVSSIYGNENSGNVQTGTGDTTGKPRLDNGI
jgi:hypothetical protein